MLEQVGSRSQPKPNPLGGLFKTSAVLRIGSGLVLMTRHAWDALFDAYEFVWKEVPWEWATAFGAQNVPLPHLLAPTAALVLFAIALAWTTGFLTRFFAFLMLVLCGIAMGFVHDDSAAFAELVWLYLLIAFTLVLFGSGSFSLDRLFRFGAERSAKPKTFRY